jgi:hypothetical protein
MPAEGPTAVFVIRAWLESPGEGGLRARIVQTLDVSSAVKTETVAAAPEEVLAAVDEWLQRVGDAGVTHPG